MQYVPLRIWAFFAMIEVCGNLLVKRQKIIGRSKCCVGQHFIGTNHLELNGRGMGRKGNYGSLSKKGSGLAC